MNAREVKDALAARAEEFARWLFPAGKKIGQIWRVGSVDGEAGQSLGINLSGGKVGVFRDHNSGDAGANLVELYARAKQVPFKDALHACADWLGVEVISNASQLRRERSGPAPTNTAQPFPTDDDLLSVEQCRDALRMISALADNLGLCERIARKRGWNVETIQGLTREPSLGWHDGKLAFVYETGVKLRWRQGNERVIRWAFGKPWIWRGCLLRDAETVYLCEGETDAISLIDAGLEKRKNTFAVALPSASTFNASWAESFRGKEVVLVLDADKAGSEATSKVSKLLQACECSVKQLNWGGLQHAG